jgi:hypothetical protein
MASTYSITFSIANGNVGYGPTNPLLPVTHQLEDAYASPPAGTTNANNQAQAMQLNTQVQAKRTDGSLRYYTLDSSRSDPSKNLIFLLPV